MNEEKNISIKNNTDNTATIKDRDIKIKMTPLKWIIIFSVAIVSSVLNYIFSKNILECAQVLIITGLLTYMSLLDIELHLAPDWISFAIFGVSIPNVVINIISKDWRSLIYMGCGLLVCFIPLIIAALVSGGIGGADVKLMMALGFYLGLKKAFFTLILGLLLAVIFNLIKIIATKSDKKAKFALIPYLAVGSLYFLIF